MTNLHVGKQYWVMFALISLILLGSMIPLAFGVSTSPAAIYIAGDVEGFVDIFNQNGNPTLSFFGDFTIDDGFAVGDVDGNGLDEILIAGDETGIVDIFDQNGNANNPSLPSFFGDFTIDDGFAVGGSYADRDGDGLLDQWETVGFDSDGDGTVDVDLPGFGADPDHKDLFLEFDWVTGQEPTQSAIQTLKAAFAAAPIDAGGTANPDGQPGINLWVDTGGLTDPQGQEDAAGSSSCSDGIDNGADGLTDTADPDCLVGDNLGGGNAIGVAVICALDGNFYNAKSANFDRDDRRSIFRYAISGQGCDLDGDGNIDSGGWGELGGNDFIEYNHDPGTIMHELGHTLNLDHGGNEPDNCKPNYVSVMNYDHQIGIPQVGGGSIIDYSPPRFPDGRGNAPIPDLDENNLSETLTILDPTDATNMFIFVDGNGNKVQWPLNSDIDGDGTADGVNWNGDKVIADTGLPVNVDTDGGLSFLSDCTNSAFTVLTGHHDWDVIALNFRPFGDSLDGPINPVQDPTPTLIELLELQEELNTTDLEITKSESADPVVAGNPLTYTLTIRNNGPNPAYDVVVVDNLPSGVSHTSNDAGCVEGPIGTLTCDLGDLVFGESAEIVINVTTDCDEGQVLSNTATVQHLAGPDLDTSNNSITEETTVLSLEEAIQKLIDDVKSMGLSKGVTASLIAPLSEAVSLLANDNAEDDVAVFEKLDTFLKILEGYEQKGKVTAEQAEQLRELVEAIKVGLECA